MTAGRKTQRRIGKLAQSLARGHALLARGDISGADAESDRALALAPSAPDTLGLIGLVALAGGRNEDAERALLSAFEQAPERADVAVALGRARFRLARWTAAEVALRASLALEPNNADAWVLLGLVLWRAGNLEAGIAAFEQALAIDPGNVPALINLGNAAREQADMVQAGSCYRAACAQIPSSAPAHFHLGVWLRETGQNEAARFALERAVERDPAYVEALFNLANVLCDLGAPDEAVLHMERAMQLRPSDVALLLRCAALLADNDRIDSALAALERAARIAPNDAAVLNNLGMALHRAGHVEQALAAYDAALVLEPNGSARLNRALALLLEGRWAEGWSAYGARWLDAAVLERIGETLGCPQWDGGALAGRTVFIVGEQGLGDEIMFASILPEIIAESGRVILQCSLKLERLFSRSFPDVCMIGADRVGREWPQAIAQRARASGPIDVFATLGEVARFRRASEDAFPSHAGYLRADSERVGYWRDRLHALGPGAAIGLSWRGGTEATGRNRRSMALRELLPLLRRRGVHWVSLQYTDCAQELAEISEREGVTIHHWPDAIADYDETAALVCALDEVISVCTSVVHLAGALDVPVRVMAPAVPEWRYGRSGERMPWYPSVSIERQRAPGEWAPVVATIAAIPAPSS